jgi:hypothetical protein
MASLLSNGTGLWTDEKLRFAQPYRVEAPLERAGLSYDHLGRTARFPAYIHPSACSLSYSLVCLRRLRWMYGLAREGYTTSRV